MASKNHELARKEFETKLAAIKNKKALTKDLLETDTRAPWDIGLGRLYCKAISLLSPKPRAAHAQTVSSTPRTAGVAQAGSSTPKIRPPTATGTVTHPASKPPSKILIEDVPPNSSDLAMLQAQRIRLDDSAQLMEAYGVEIHKKFALAVACFVFVLLGAPIALRFPRGGVGLTIGVSLFVFALYYVCLIAGESLGKRGLMPAVVSMWMANVIFGLIALWMLAKMGREGSTARGGDMREMFDSIRGSIRSRIGRKKPVIQTEPESVAA